MLCPFQWEQTEVWGKETKVTTYKFIDCVKNCAYMQGGLCQKAYIELRKSQKEVE